MKDLKIISVDNLHQVICDFIKEEQNMMDSGLSSDGAGDVIGDYEDMKVLILTMIKAGYMFNMDRDRLRDAMEDITFMLCPDDDANKDRVERGLEYDDSEDEIGIEDIE